ncbi:Acyl-CoA thioesterase I [Georgfuchsia toluolica]|uniref:Acyl-CoA thioesterase I n=1 Tax=Georgfuchsia toluolica TaxID=424218 RepID=A0A916J286_9PROT|nr:GDSL-type esterase/lipase family protein [Georgfuchsia toluolica]CAG4882642.1 Acyl-CoA thioesterase I [Georgfuchsia toluolica]
MNSRLCICFAALLTFLALAMAACHRAPSYAALPPGSVVLAFGDSVTFGIGAAGEENYPSQLVSISGWQVANRGVPGDTAEEATARIAEALDVTQPKLVIVEIGGNDFLRRHPEAQIKEDIRSILKTVKQAGVPVALVATPRFSLLGATLGALPDAALYAELAKEEGVLLVPDVFAEVLSDPSLKSDQIHPNAAGYRKLAEGIAASLVKSGLLAKR